MKEITLFRNSLDLFCEIMTVVVVTMKRNEEVEETGTHRILMKLVGNGSP